MTPADAAELLAIAAAADRRTVGEVEAKFWAKALAGLEPRDCAEAIANHYARTTDWLMPAHVRAEVRRIRDERFKVVGNADPAYEKDNVLAGLEAIRQHRRAVGNGIVTAPPMLPPNRAGQDRLEREMRPVMAAIEARAAAVPRPKETTK